MKKIPIALMLAGMILMLTGLVQVPVKDPHVIPGFILAVVGWGIFTWNEDGNQGNTPFRDNQTRK